MNNDKLTIRLNASDIEALRQIHSWLIENKSQWTNRSDAIRYALQVTQRSLTQTD